MSPFDPANIGTGYDYGLGVSASHIAYIKQSHLIQARISPTPCYLLQRKITGTSVGFPGAQITPRDSQFETINNQYFLTIWASGSNHPDTRPYVNKGQGNIGIFINTVSATRVISIEDITSNTEFAVVEDKTKFPAPVKVVFQSGFNPVGQVTYYYTTLEEGVEDLSIHRGDSNNQSIFGWAQWINSYQDDFQRQNQVLVRFPLNTRDTIIMDEGKVIVENRDSWIPNDSPYVNDFDVLILTSVDSPDGQEYRYEIVNSLDSVIQRQLVSQRFKLSILEKTDVRYSIPFTKVA